ncbi:TPA: hypothetical protein H1009_03175, partial [archaeon]|nr:hypothetical protein [Candidatus Naiadarchaeales archaeon SRR2090153.bin461]
MNGLTKSGTILLLLITLLAVSVAFVGIAVAQSNCTVNSSGGCSGQAVVAPNEPGNYTYTVCFDFNGDRDVLDPGECTTTTLQVVDTTKPSALISLSDADGKIEFGTALTLTGTGTEP